MNSATAKANELESRLISFAAAILSVSTKLPKTPQSRHISNQILRSGTAAEPISFIKWGITLKELNETVIWLQIILKAQLLPNAEIVAVILEKPRALSDPYGRREVRASSNK